MDDFEPLDAMLLEITGAVDYGLNLVALAMAASIPSICASLYMPDGRSQGPEYKEWCRLNLRPGRDFDVITDDELYLIRCGLLHQGPGKLERRKGGRLTPNDGLHRIVFVLDGPVSFGDSSNSDVYVYTVRKFCGNMASATREWMAKEQSNPIVAENLTAMILYRPFEAPGFQIRPTLMAIY